jgi:hypothetical protein
VWWRSTTAPPLPDSEVETEMNAIKLLRADATLMALVVDALAVVTLRAVASRLSMA